LKTFAILLLLALWIIPVYAADGITAADWLRMDSLSRSVYVVGVIDGWSHLQLMRRAFVRLTEPMTLEQGLLDDTVSCLRARNPSRDQVGALVAQYVEANPDERSRPMASTVFSAVEEVCQTLKKRMPGIQRDPNR